MTDINQDSTNKSGDLIAAVGFIPFLFFIPLFKKGAEQKYMLVAKEGALLTAIFLLPVITTAIISVGIGSFLYGVFVLFAAFMAYKAYNNEILKISFLEKYAAKIPLEYLLKKAAETVKNTGLEGKISDPSPAQSNTIPQVNIQGNITNQNQTVTTVQNPTNNINNQ